MKDDNKKTTPLNSEKSKKEKSDESTDTAHLIKKKELLEIPGITENPIVMLVIKKYAVKKRINLNMLIEDLYMFLKPGNKEFKLKFLFSLYCNDDEKFITSTGMFELLKQLNRAELEDYKLQNIVDQTFAEIGEYTTQMNYAQFVYLLEKNDFAIHRLL